MTDGTQPVRQGLPPLAWVGIGCAVLAVIGVAVVALTVGFGVFTAKRVIDKHVDISDGQVTVKTEEGEYTVDTTDAKEGGKVTFTGPDGTATLGATLDNVPAWVLLYPDASKHQGTYNVVANGQAGGAVVSTTSDDPDKVAAYFEEKLADEGFEVQKHTVSAAGYNQMSLIGTKKSPERSLTVIVGRNEGETQIVTNYSGPEK